MTTSNGGPAFPMGTAYQGMTLRDYFAAKVMQGWLSTYSANHGPDEVYEDGVAEFAYKIADAMLKAREV